MPYVVTENCILCKHTDCVDVCPVTCFHEGPNFLVINPAGCIDCGVCMPECPVDAIRADDNLTKEERIFVELNRDLARVWPSIYEKRDALPDAERWANVPGKLEMLVR
jgi:ferredoxin